MSGLTSRGFSQAGVEVHWLTGQMNAGLQGMLRQLTCLPKTEARAGNMDDGFLRKQILHARSNSTDSISPQWQCTLKAIGRQQTSQSSMVENVPDEVSTTVVKTAPQ
jgi:hypothetical protein